jgi:uncharacterized protein YebE (UPF0316 family)
VTDLFIARGLKLAARKVAGEMVILNADDSSLYVLNAVGTAIWEAADGRTPLRAIVNDVICRDYDIDRETALRDIGDFVRELAAYGVLRTSEHAMAGADANHGSPEAAIR